MSLPTAKHVPVLLQETLKYLVSNENGTYFDCTLGDGGYTRGILNTFKDTKVIATDTDAESIAFSENWSEPYEGRLFIFHGNFKDISSVMEKVPFKNLTGIVADLGLSSRQLDSEDRGFSHRQDAFLDMRMNDKLAETAADIINTYEQKALRDIFFKYGEEKRSGLLAKIIVDMREQEPIKTTGQLRGLMSRYWRPAHFNKSAARIFQALRIAVNKELESLELFLESCWQWLVPGGRLAVVSYHSLEDRLVKQSIKLHENPCICPPEFPVCNCGNVPDAKIITKKPVTPTGEEVEKNPRAKSAKLRVAEKI